MKNLATALLICALSSLTAACAGIDMTDDIDSISHEIRAVIVDTTPVTQASCSATQETVFARLSAEEQRVLQETADAFNKYHESQKPDAALGCQVSPGSASCEAFGYVCWVQVFPGGPGEPDELDYGCAKETC